MARFLVLFMVLLAALFALEMLQPVQRHVVLPWTSLLADASGWLGPYAKEAELNDPWKQPYTYKVPGEGGPFDLVSTGADRKVGGESVNADIRYK